MKLIERLGDTRKKTEGGRSGTEAGNIALRGRLHAAVIDKLDMRIVAEVDSRRMRERLRPSVASIIEADAEVAMLQPPQRQELIEALLDEIAGLGPLEALLNDPDISDILVNNWDTVYIERRGVLERAATRFNDNQHLLNIVQRIVSRVGRRVDESSPMVDARLADGSRVNAVVPPIAIDGPSLSIRRFGTRLMGADDLVARGVGSADMFKFLAACVASATNLLISGGTGAGKTTLLNVLSGFIPPEERTITIEDSAELNLMGHHVVRMEARPANIEGKGEVTIRTCVRNALRMRPNRVVIGEVRGAEVLDMLTAMNTGHEGSMATVHANTPRDAVDRLTMMLALSGVTLTSQAMSSFISRSVRIIVQVARFLDGKRRITHIAEVEEEATDRAQVRIVFSWDHAQGKFVYHKNSQLAARFAEHHIQLDLGALS